MATKAGFEIRLKSDFRGKSETSVYLAKILQHFAKCRKNLGGK